MTRTRRTPPALSAHDPAFEALKARIIARTGHDYYRDKDDQLIERIAERMAATGQGADAYLALLDGDAGGDEWAALESGITINETFFFRFAEQFDVLRRILLPRLIAARAQDKRLRIWSVGCSTGAEPYSIAIILSDLLGDGIADWRIAITGTDIDQAALHTAREARYTGWAMRTLGEDERARLFDREGAAYRLKPRYRGLVRFERHNMVDLLGESAALQFVDFDLILCRNVLIYFSQPMAKAMVGALANRLAADGHLFLGHAEPSPDFAEVAGTVDLAGLLVYRRPDSAVEAPAEPAIVAPAAAPIARPARPQPARAAKRAPRPAPPPETQPPPSGVPFAELRAALAAGDAGQALRLADEQAARVPRDPVAHYLGALGALALGEKARAERGFRNALYLDNRFAMGHYLLGRHLLAEGRADEGRRALGNALRAVRDLPADAELVEGDGMTAAMLADAARSAMA